MHSAPGEYHGFLWFYFINEQLLRFLNLRYPRDYNTVPRLYFWLFHLLWLFPWSVYFPAVAKLSFQAARPRRARRACWRCAGPASSWSSSPFPPRRNIIRCPAIRRWRCCWDRRWPRAATGSDAARAFCAEFSLLRGGGGADAVFSGAESSHAGRHFRGAQLESGRLHAFARPHGRPDASRRSPICALPLLVAAIAFLVGAAGTFRATGQRAFLAAALMMVLFFQAARMAHGGVRSLSLVAAAGGGAAARAAGKADRGSSLLHVLIDLLLHQSRPRCC